MFMFITQAIGVLGMLACFVSFQINKKTSILLFQILSTGLFAVHYFLLFLQGEPALTGALIDVFNILKLFVIFNIDADKLKISRALVVVIATIINVTIVIFTWQSWISILPVLGAFFETVSFALKKPSNVRKLFLASIPFWFAYNIITKAWPGLISGVFAFTSLAIAFVRFDILKQQDPSLVENKNENEQEN